MTKESLCVADMTVAPGERAQVQVPAVRRFTHSEVVLPCEIVNGKLPGPVLFVSAALHGDEINGVEIVRRLLKRPELRRLRGALIAVPIVNVHGFLQHSRYLPDRRDLNRCFPGSTQGSLAARVAHKFMKEIVSNATHGIDLHTGALHRTNLPQVRACLDQPETERLAEAFGAPLVLHANLRDGSLRQAVLERDVPMLVYEGGEALRFGETAIRTGLRGVLSVMAALEMIPPRKVRKGQKPVTAQSSKWVRAPDSGLLRTKLRPGSQVAADQVIGHVSSPLGDHNTPIIASCDGVVIGQRTLPLVDEGDALFHIATFERPTELAEQLAFLEEDLLDE
ncbi:MAG: succinylglutamate desuccinylase/aspartoacylase family protein [Myxococcales bacterium]|nr:succinylglutamate desuccinylase/aspartoacylase family protein [Myxococcales bacterium]